MKKLISARPLRPARGRNKAGLALLTASLAACSTLQTQYLEAGYDPASPQAVKRIAVTAWAADAKLAELLAAVATDRLKLKSNYLISHTGTVRSWDDACEQREGVLFVRALTAALRGDDVHLRLVAELYACSTGAMLWRSEAAGTHPSEDVDLQELSRSYVAKVGDAAGRWAGPAFVILRDMLDVLPNPTLSDEEFLEKIELGSQGASAPLGAVAAVVGHH